MSARGMGRWLLLVGCLHVVNQGLLGSEFSEFLHDVFDDQHDRAPSGSELYYHANVYQAGGPLANQIVLLGSDDYFFNRCQGDYATYVTNMYRYFLHRDPRADELQFWVNQFRQGGSNRTAVLWQFCTANQVNQLPSFPDVSPSLPPYQTAPQLARELVNQAGAFVGIVRRDLSGSRWGQQVGQQSEALLVACRQYRQLLSSGQATPQQWQIAANNAQQALYVVENEFRRYPGASPQCELMVRNLGQLLTAVQNAPLPDNRPPWPGWRPPSSPQNPTSPGIDAWNAVQNLHAVANQFVSNLYQYQSRSPYYANVYRNAQSFVVQIDALEMLMKQGAGRGRVQRAMGDIQRTASLISSSIGRGDVALERGWQNVLFAMNQAGSALGIRAETYAEPGRAVVATRPVWNQFPLPGNQSVTPLPRNQQAVNLADNLISQLNTYAETLRPLTARSTAAVRLMGSLQDLQHVTHDYRQQAAQGAYGAQLRYVTNSLVQQYQVTAQEFAQLVAQNPAMNSPLFMQIGESVEQIRRISP